MTVGALGGVVVVDLTSGVGGAYAGKLLADLGAEVVLVEPPDGSPLRRRPPLRAGGTDGLWFEHLSGAKRSVVPADAAALGRLVDRADLLLRDGSSSFESWLPALLPDHVVRVELSPWGRSGPYAGWRSSDLALWAMGGYLNITGSPERAPLWLPGSQAELHAGANAAFAALVGLYEQRRGGWGQAVEVSALESVLTAHAWLVSSWAACGQVLTRVGNDLIRMADGWAYVMRIAPNDELFVLIDRPDLAAENLTDDVVTWFANIPRIFEAVAEWARDQTVEHIVDLGQALRVAVTPVLDAAGVRADPQLEARGWWEDGFPGQPYHLSASPSRRRGPAPTRGQHSDEPLPTSQPVPRSRPEAPRRPPVGAPPPGPALEGLTVLEVTANWAGPIVGRFLADLGADVVKVERAAKPATRALWWVGPDQDQQRQGHHRAMYFNEMNRGKRDVCLDLARPEGRAVFLRLVERADVLIENNSARVMGNLELDWPALQRVNPRLIMVSMSGYGADGPRRDWLAYGSNIETTSGLTSLTGYPDGELSRTGLFYADPVSGIHGAVAVMAALEHRRRTGEGQWIELALNECGVAFCAEALLTLAATGVVPGPNANRDPRFAPHGVYPCAGVDKWVAIAVQSDEEWPVLAALAGRPELADDPELASLAGRWRRHDELDAALAAWTATLEQYEVAWACQRAGISAAPVLANWQVLPDPHLHHRGFFQPQEHPVVGVYPTPTWPWRLSRTPARLGRPAPLFAEHNREILTEAGLDDAEVAALYANGATADQPE